MTWQSSTEVLADGSLYCTNFIIFPYLDDVYEGDGGLFFVPGLHRGSLNHPRGMKMFDWQGHPAPAPAGALGICPKASSYVIMTEATTHAATPWTPTDRVRRAFALRYQPHDFPTHNEVVWRAWLGERILARRDYATNGAGVAGADPVARFARAIESDCVAGGRAAFAPASRGAGDTATRAE
jgi:hypothetical protein